MQYLGFKNGDRMPALGLGTWKSAAGEVFNAVIEAIKTGYRHIDCAHIYGNEAEVGQALEQIIADRILRRDELWITSKLWNDSHRREHVLPALKTTLKNLHLDYLDLYLIHWPVALRHGVTYPKSADDFVSLEEAPLRETWAALEECVDAGLVRHIGVSNFNSQKIDEVLRGARIRPEMNQVELHPLLPQNGLLAYCRKHDIHVTAYSPLGSRDRTGRRKEDPNLFENETIGEIAAKHDCSPVQVLLSWHLHRGTAVIPKSTTPKHIRQNFESIHIRLDGEDMDRIAGLATNYRFIDGSLWTPKGSPYTMSGLWERV